MPPHRSSCYKGLGKVGYGSVRQAGGQAETKRQRDLIEMPNLRKILCKTMSRSYE